MTTATKLAGDNRVIVAQELENYSQIVVVNWFHLEVQTEI